MLLISLGPLGAGCESFEAAPSSRAIQAIDVPAEHPCPEIAVPAVESSLWEELLPSDVPAPLALLIPLEVSQSATVSQGNAQLPTHTLTVAYAWDLEVPLGTSVTAAAPGVVVWVRDDSDTHGEGAESLNDANWLVVDHGAGLFSSYVHLEAGSALVSAGQLVASGERLASTGLSGLLTGAHVHFQLENSWSESLPAAFVGLQETPDCAWVPTTGEVVGRPAGVAEHLVGRGEVSDVPSDAFEVYGVLELYGLKARLMSRQRVHPFIGRAAPGMDEVWVLVFSEAGGDAVLWEGVHVSAGHFTGSLDLTSLSPGRYGWAAVAVQAGVSPEVPRTVRMSLVD